jgi:hypothetical protein
MTVMLDGQKVGRFHATRDVRDGQVVTTQTLDLRLNRVKTPMVVHTTLGATESTAGVPLGFSSQSGEASGSGQVSAQRRDDGAFQVDRSLHGQSTVGLMAWPEGALLPEGQRLATVSHGFKPGTSYALRVFEPSRQQVGNLRVTVVGDEWVDLPGGKERLHHLQQRLDGSGDAQLTETWVDDEGIVRRSLAPLMAFRIEMAACDASCANAPDQDVDILRAAMVASPRELPGAQRTVPMRYTVSVRGQRPNPLVNTDEQRVTDLGGGNYQVDIGFAPDLGPGGEPGPTIEDTAANPWVQSSAPEIRAMALKIVGDAKSDAQRMRRLRSYLTYYINKTALDVGYGSALDTLASRRGDCTEHAVLFAALARSLGIPTRVVSGLVYNDRFGGANRVFVPHAWVQAWLDGYWVSFDSAQGIFDTTHIALAVGDGDPWRFFASTTALGSIHIDRVEPLEAAMNVTLPGVLRPDLVRKALDALFWSPGGSGTR